MDGGYPPSSAHPPVEYNHASVQSLFSHYFLDQTNPSASMQTPEHNSGPLCFPFDPHHSASDSFSSTPLIDYAIFDTPLDISLGALPPRPTSSRALAQGRIPRPRNAFMLFRSAFHREKRLAKSVEKDHRHISRIIGLCWAELSEAEKDVWRHKAEIEKQQHALAYPEYRFKPTPRTKQPIKRNVKRNSPKEIERCHKIAQLLQDGKSGEELTHAVKRMEDDQFESTASSGHENRRSRKGKTFSHVHPPVTQHLPDPYSTAGPPLNRYVALDQPPPFRSPLLPPSEFCETQSKRPESAAIPVDSAHTMPSQPTTISDPIAPDHNMYPPQTYATLGYLQHGLDQSSKLRQRLQADNLQTFEWSAKDFVAVPFDQSSLKPQYSDSSHHTHHTSLGSGGSLHSPSYTPGHRFVPSIIPSVGMWGAYYRREVAPGFTEPLTTGTGVYESLLTSSTNLSASPV